MKEKYTYESDKESPPEDTILFISLALFVITFIIRGSLERKGFFTLLSISLVLFICWVVFLNLQGFFAADDKAVTFGRIFKKRIEYSSIKSIDMVRSTIRRRHKRRRYAKLVEWITFHCEDGDHRFAGVLVPEREIRSSGEEMAMFNNDWSNSPFSRLKIYIEDRIKTN
jgi:hypothetical protein